VIVSNSLFTSGNILESGLVGLLVNFNELGTEFDINSVLLKVFLDELISSVEVLAERLVSVDDGEFVNGRNLSVSLVPSPDLSSREEVERGNFSSVWVRRNGVDSIAVSVVIDPSLMFHIIRSPAGMLSVGKDGMVEVRPSFFETLNSLCIFSNSCGNN